jgi:RNA polymerase sigma factor for flagellar operon FliA
MRNDELGMTNNSKFPIHHSSFPAEAIATYAPLIRYCAQRLKDRLPPCVELDDLLQAGAEGLLDALERYDPAHACGFKTYAEHRIRGAMLDALRQLDWVPHTVRRQVRTLEQAWSGLAQALGRDPEEAELAAYLGLSLDTLGQWLLALRGVTLLTLDCPQATLRRLGLLEPHTSTPEQEVAAAQGRARLGRAIDALPYQQRVVLGLYYQEALTMKEIGQVLRLTESRISQLHTLALLRLRVQLAREDW